MRKKSILLIILIFSCSFLVFGVNTIGREGFKNLKVSQVFPNEPEISNITVISDGYEGEYWNQDKSTRPSIAMDSDGNIHSVWEDYTSGEWGSPPEIMYTNYSRSNDISNATVISNNYDLTAINNEDFRPSITIDTNNVIHVVWWGNPNGPWRYSSSDYEILYVNYTQNNGWSNITIISDDSTNWNTDSSADPDIISDSNGNLHVVWKDRTSGPWQDSGSDSEIMYINYTHNKGWSNITVISDGYQNEYWNNGNSEFPSIGIDGNDNLFVAWQDGTDGVWGTDTEIMIVNRTFDNGWSNVTVISDGYQGEFWNDGESLGVSIDVDNDGGVYAAWQDETNGTWGTDTEIMYASYTETTGWSNGTVISDGYLGEYWNNGDSTHVSLDVDVDKRIHMAWQDITDGPWRVSPTDSEIMYTTYKEFIGWSNVSIISDGYEGEYWNNLDSREPSIVADNQGDFHVIWEDKSSGPWLADSGDSEILYVFGDFAPLVSDNGDEDDPIIPFGSTFLIFMGIGIITILLYYKLKQKPNY